MDDKRFNLASWVESTFKSWLKSHFSKNQATRFMMHDFINYLAPWVGRGTYFRMEDGSEENLKKGQHFSYLCDHSNLSELTRRLRTFLPLVPQIMGLSLQL